MGFFLHKVLAILLIETVAWGREMVLLKKNKDSTDRRSVRVWQNDYGNDLYIFYLNGKIFYWKL